MNRRQHVRRVAILCCHCLRNLAFFFSGRPNGKQIFTEQFWVTTGNNFLDIAVLEWCKLFVDARGKHHWTKVITDHAAFSTGLFDAMTLTDPFFKEYIEEMRTYRDKFVAHLDFEERMQIPNLRAAQRSTAYLYDYLRAHEDEGNFLIDAPETAGAFYKAFQKEGNRVYTK
jgi:hypothetical protein